MAQVAFLISGDADKLSKALAKADAQFSKAEKGANDTAKAVARITKEEREAAKEMARFQREAERIKQSVQSPMERYSQQVMKLERHLEAGRIEQHEYTAAVAKLKQEMYEASPAFERLKRSEAKAAAELKRFKTEAESIKASIKTPIQKYREEVARLEKHLEKGTIDQKQFNAATAKARANLDAVKKSGKGAFSFGGDLSSLATSFLGVSAAIQAVAGAINTARQAAKEAADAQLASRIDVGSLAQVATSQKDFASLKKAAEKMFASGGADSMSEAAQAIFSLRSAGQDQYLDLFSSLRGSGVIADPAGMAKAATTLQTAMGKKETGNIRDILSKAFGASQYSPASAESLLEASARSGTGARAMGVSDEEVLAATAIAATSTGSAEMGGTQVASLMKSFEKMGGDGFNFSGMSLMEMVKKVEGKGLKNDELTKLFGRQEALNAYRVLLLNQKKYGEALGATRQAEKGDLLGKKIGYVASDPGLGAAWARRKAEAKEELSGDRIGQTANLYQAFRREYEAKKRQEGRWEVTAGFDKWNEGYRRSWYGEDHLLREAMRSGQLDEVSPELQKRIRGHYGETVKAGRVRPDQTPADIARGGAQHVGGEELREAARELSATAKEQREAAREMRETMAKHNATLEATRRSSLGNPTVDK